jgi:hypothetical protein
MTSYFLCMIKNFIGPLICTVVLELWNMLWEEGGDRTDTSKCAPWCPPNHTRQRQIGHRYSVKLAHVSRVRTFVSVEKRSSSK